MVLCCVCCASICLTPASRCPAHGLLAGVSSERAQLTEKREEIARLEAEVAAMPSELEAAKAKQEAAELMLARQRAEYERQEASVREQLAELTKGPEFYASRLGLAFEEMRDSNLRCVFTLIDPAAPDRRFCFNLRVNDDDSYGVSGCDPDVPDLPQLVTQLNAANDLGSFFRDMRKRFQAIAGVRSSSGGGSSRGGAGGR